MKLLTSLFLFLRLALGESDVGSHNYNLVDPFIGSTNGGNVFAGASLPYGMAKAVPDVSGENTGGWAYDFTNITGFSAQHDSGTGGNPSQGMFPLSVQPWCRDDKLENCRWGSKYERSVYYRPQTPRAQPGYFSIGIKDGIDVETTVTEHTALWNFRFTSNVSTHGNALSPLMLVDLTDIQDSRQNASVKVDPATGRMSGNGTFLPSFGVGSYMSYYCIDFKGADVRDTGVWVNERAGTEPKELFVNRGYSLFYIQAGGFVRFKKPLNNLLQARVGVSFLSTEQACQNAEQEIPDWNFNRVRKAAEDAWKEKLSDVSIETGGVNKSIQRTFFSGIYRTMMSPQNYTGQNPLFSSSDLYFDSYYCTWDSFRTTFPFLTIFDPKAMSQLIQSYLNIYKVIGWLPDCRMQLCKGYTQGGSNADNVIADAYVKNLTGIDWTAAYEAVKNDAENEPFDWGVEGRGGLQSWKRYGYIPVLDFDTLGFGPDYHSISRTLEYAYNDFCIAAIAKGLGNMADYEKYLQRSGNWYNLWKHNQTSFIHGKNTGFTGFLQPRYANGTWRYQNPIECSPLDSFLLVLLESEGDVRGFHLGIRLLRAAGSAETHLHYWWAGKVRQAVRLSTHERLARYLQRAVGVGGVPIPLRRSPWPLLRPPALLHPLRLQLVPERLTRQRRQRRFGLFRRLRHERLVPRSGPERLPHHPALLRERELHFSAYGQNGDD